MGDQLFDEQLELAEVPFVVFVIVDHHSYVLVFQLDLNVLLLESI